MWALITQSCNQSSGGLSYICEGDNFKSYGALVASMLHSVGIALKSLMSFVTQHQSQPAGFHVHDTNEMTESGHQSNNRDDAQSLLEAIYKGQLIGCIVESFR